MRPSPEGKTDDGQAVTDRAHLLEVGAPLPAEGKAGLWDRSSAPHRVPNRTPEARIEAIAALGRVRMTGPEIVEALEMASSTVSAVLGRIGLGKLSRPSRSGAMSASAPAS
jgi:hypothetical protein